MSNLRDDLERCLRGRVCVVGVGNPDRGDDGLGLRLAEALRDVGYPDVIVAERTPERWMGRLARRDFHTVLFLDAVEMGASAGSAALLEATEIVARYPQISTHKLSLGTLARLIEADGLTRVLVLGVQPNAVQQSGELSETVRTSVRILRDLLAEILSVNANASAACGGRP